MRALFKSHPHGIIRDHSFTASEFDGHLNPFKLCLEKGQLYFTWTRLPLRNLKLTVLSKFLLFFTPSIGWSDCKRFFVNHQFIVNICMALLDLIRPIMISILVHTKFRSVKSQSQAFFTFVLLSLLDHVPVDFLGNLPSPITMFVHGFSSLIMTRRWE